MRNFHLHLLFYSHLWGGGLLPLFNYKSNWQIGFLHFCSLFSLIFSPEMTIHARQEKSEGRREKSEKNQKETPTHLRELAFLFGAAKQIRTADLVITNDVLYHLSYSSIFYAADFHLRHNLATVKGLAPSTSSVTGWRTNRLYYTAIWLASLPNA